MKMHQKRDRWIFLIVAYQLPPTRRVDTYLCARTETPGSAGDWDLLSRRRRERLSTLAREYNVNGEDTCFFEVLFSLNTAQSTPSLSEAEVAG